MVQLLALQRVQQLLSTTPHPYQDTASPQQQDTTKPSQHRHTRAPHLQDTPTPQEQDQIPPQLQDTKPDRKSSPNPAILPGQKQDLLLNGWTHPSSPPPSKEGMLIRFALCMTFWKHCWNSWNSECCATVSIIPLASWNATNTVSGQELETDLLPMLT